MKNILSIAPCTLPNFCTHSSISFRKFFDFISHKISTEHGLQKQLYQLVWDRILDFPELYGSISLEKISQYEEILELTANCIVPLVEDKQNALWALGNAFTPDIFYGSQAFYKLIELKGAGTVNISLIDTLNTEESLARYKRLQYAFVLEKLYHINSTQKSEWIQSFINPDTGLYQHYRVNVDRHFVEVFPKGELPHSEEITALLGADPDHNLNILDQILPLDLFESSGFTILTFTDVTQEYTLEQLSKQVSPPDLKKQAAHTFQHINRLLQTIIDCSNYQFGLLPFPTINNRPAVLYERHPFSIIAKACRQASVSRELFTYHVKQFLESPHSFLFPALSKEQSFPDPIQKALRDYGIQYYTLFPVYHQERIVGILEACSFDTASPLNILQLSKLQPTFSLLSQLLNSTLLKFSEMIDNIIKDKFTNIQSSVQWRFNEAAWHHLRNNFMDNKNEPMEKILFKSVYPLYGAVDIRNSTLEQTHALHEDLQVQLKILTETLQEIHSEEYQQRIEQVVQAARQWRQVLLGFISTEEEIRLQNFLKNEANALLHQLSQSDASIATKTQHYWSAIHERTGIAFENRRSLESSIQLINSTLNQYFEEAKEGLQELYPSYFEKYRTDGVEYDIYIGQSLAPKIPFKIEYLQQIRFWQIRSMAAIAQSTYSLLPRMSRPLRTTQLLFVYPQPIDIHFRQDERRFDVEGSYNIRYHLVKKRIDKIHIRHTGERLTQPDKIAVVYFHEKDIQEYLEYIRELQQQTVLADDLEFLDLEELQGVSGLKALRVGVKMETDHMEHEN